VDNTAMDVEETARLIVLLAREREAKFRKRHWSRRLTPVEPHLINVALAPNERWLSLSGFK